MIDLPPCPNENEGPRHSWIMSAAANIYAHRAIKEAVYLITSKLTRAPSPYNEVDTSVRKAFAEAAEYAGRNGGGIPQQQTCHAFDNSGDVDRAAKERAAKRAAWPELTAPSEAAAGERLRSCSLSRRRSSRRSAAWTCCSAPSHRKAPPLSYCDRERKTAASLRLDGEPWQSSGQPEKFLPGSERGWPVGLDKGASPIFLAAGAAGFVRIFHLLWCADMEREVAAVALLDTALPISPAAARHLFAGRKICAFFDMETRVASALLFVKLPTNIKAGADFSESTHAYAIVHPLRACAEDDFLVMSAALPIGMT